MESTKARKKKSDMLFGMKKPSLEILSESGTGARASDDQGSSQKLET